ncbi:SIR2 family protein [Salinicoccus sp. ID82-1]|uniref:SIR2 family protein n=1 Tax=Salinicoccus sp. ID82-1 TaxID=2820269 RepID=UPI001F40ED84|nr:SIR2 family protein [Salinicoccus sp. ID82-1]MCG1010770.1 SIR2 family protein [Salinicoccus sp. ID82-1]
MQIKDFVKGFNNHPVMFVGTGFSLRYLENSFTWDGLLSHIAQEIKGSEEYYLDLKYNSTKNGKVNFDKIASSLESDFQEALKKDRVGKFKDINDEFYDNLKNGKQISRFKLYISKILSEYKIKDEKQKEIAELKKVRKNIGSIITTNYDTFLEDVFEFAPLIGNEILLSNPYGSTYKIHGCITEADKIIITQQDYKKFYDKYELIRAQLLSLFIHNPIIFLGYSINDENIKEILQTIFTYVDPNTEEAEKIRRNFLLVEYNQDSSSTEVTDHDIDMQGFSTIRINKIKTDNFMELYKNLSKLSLPVSAMDVRKVQNVVREIYSGGNLQVSITEDIDSLENDEKVLAIGSYRTIKYEFQTSSEMMENYFSIIDESNDQLLKLIDKHRIQKNQYFPIYGFNKIQPNLDKIDKLKEIQNEKIDSIFSGLSDFGKEHHSIKAIEDDISIPRTKKILAIALALKMDRISLDETEEYLRNFGDKKTTDYRKILCLYDYKKYRDSKLS